ncbi:type II toxin-antitoxin system Phd/YefM family antitoxin [Microbacterium aureliae]
MAEYNILEARNNLSRIIAAVESGAEEAVIMRRGRPVARIVPIDRDRRVSSGKDIVDWLAAHPLPTGNRRTTDEIEAGIRELREAGG